MITFEQAVDAMLNKKPLYYEYDGKPNTVVPEVVGTRQHILSLIRTHDSFRSEDRTPDFSWAISGASSRICGLDDVYLTHQEVVNLIVARKQEEIEKLLASSS